MKINNLNDLYIDQIRDLYNAEKQVEKSLPKMVKSSSSQELQHGFEMHLEQTKQQIDRLTQIFEELNIRPTGKACQGMEGILTEGEELLKDKGIDPAVKDAALIASAQRVEHYEIAGYGTARTYAQKLGYTKAAKLLEQTLQEERQTDEKLTQLAESGINQQAKES